MKTKKSSLQMVHADHDMDQRQHRDPLFVHGADIVVEIAASEHVENQVMAVGGQHRHQLSAVLDYPQMVPDERGDFIHCLGRFLE
jgi:hypothetical protein